jgi:hypothetical protein
MVAASEQLWGRQHSRVPLPNGNSESQLSRKRPVGCCAGAIVHCPTATQNPNCRAKGPLAAAQELGRPNCPMPQIRLPLTSAPFPACPPAQLPNGTDTPSTDERPLPSHGHRLLAAAQEPLATAQRPAGCCAGVGPIYSPTGCCAGAIGHCPTAPLRGSGCAGVDPVHWPLPNG